MAKTTLAVSNLNRPAPRWFRIAKRTIYILQAGGLLTGTLTRFGISESDQLLIAGWMGLILEVLTMFLGNGVEYQEEKHIPHSYADAASEN